MKKTKINILNKGIRFFAFFALILTFPLFLSAENLDFNYAVHNLDNGASIIAKHIPDSELVTINVRVLSGLSNEGGYAGSGISHFLEHLLFKGTKNKNSDQIRNQVKAMGGVINASTGMDSASYYITVPNESFAEALDLLVSMVMELEFTDRDFYNEKDVILKEIRLRNDDPMSKRVRELFSNAYSENVYKYPIIGYEDLLGGLTQEDLKKYHAKAYTADRLVLAVAGGVSEEEAIARARGKLSKYSRKKPWTPQVLKEPTQISGQEVEVPSNIILGYIAIGFHTTSLYSSDMYPTDVASMLLGEGEDSRLYNRLVKEKELLYSVGSINYTPRYPGLFIITGIGEPSKLEDAKEEIFKIIDEVKKGKITQQELERAKNVAISRHLHMQEETAGLASSMTISYLFTENPSYYDEYVDEVARIRESSVKKVLNKYLNQENSTTVTLVPRYGEREKALEEELQTDEEFQVLRNGLRVIIKRRSRLPLVSVIFTARGGLLAENETNNGISNITASLLVRGTKNRKEAEIVPVFEQMGGNISPFSGMNSLGLGMNILSKDYNKAMDIFEDVLKNPVFPEKEILKKKTKILASIKQKSSSIFDNGSKNLRELLYAGHPYSMMAIGQMDTIENISRDDIVDFYKAHIHPDNAVISIVGDIDPKEVYKDILARFANWKGVLGMPQEKRNGPVLKKAVRKDLVMNKEQALILLGFRGLEITDKRKHALSLLGAILSGSDGMLFYALREKEGLVYSSGAGSVPAVDPGYFFLYAATTEENLKKTEKILLRLIKEVKSGNILDEDIANAKKRLLTNHAYSLEKNSSISMLMALDELYRLGYDDYKNFPSELEKVTKDDIVEIANEILDLNRYATVVIHSEK